MISTATDEGIWINGELVYWEEPSRKVLHECAYITQKRLGGDNLCNIVDELLDKGIHPRAIAWALINTQFDLQKGGKIPASTYFRREAIKLNRARSQRIARERLNQ